MNFKRWRRRKVSLTGDRGGRGGKLFINNNNNNNLFGRGGGNGAFSARLPQACQGRTPPVSVVQLGAPVFLPACFHSARSGSRPSLETRTGPVVRQCPGLLSLRRHRALRLFMWVPPFFPNWWLLGYRQQQQQGYRTIRPIIPSQHWGVPDGGEEALYIAT